MFTFGLHEISDLEFNALLYVAAAFDKLNPSPLTRYLAELLAVESNRRERRQPGTDARVILPVGESTGEQIVAFVKFVLGALSEIRGEQRPVVDFLELLLATVRGATQRVNAAQWN